MKLVKLTLFLFLVFSLNSVVFASEATIPHSFASGDAAKAEEVNENFTSLKEAIDDNNTNVESLIDTVDGVESKVNSNSSKISALQAAAPAQNRTDIDANRTDIDTNTAMATSNMNRLDELEAKLTPFAYQYGLAHGVVPGGSLDSMSAVKFNGRTIAPMIGAGEQFEVSVNYALNNPTSCPGCIIQLRVGIIGEEAVDCVYNSIPAVEGTAATTGSKVITLTAPATPGVYHLSYDRTAQYSCITTRANDPTDFNHMLGFIIVQ